MKILVIGKVASITNWLEDCVSAWRAEGHEVAVAASRNPALSPAIERIGLSRPIGAPLARRIRRNAQLFSPDLIILIGAYHVPRVILEEVASLPGRAPLVGWVGDLFNADAGKSAALLDLVAYTDSGLLSLHRERAFPSPARYLPHATSLNTGGPPTGERRPMMVFVGNPTPHRRMIVAGLQAPMTLYGPGWVAEGNVRHEIVAHRIAKAALPGIYSGHMASLNIRNEHNVLDGLNQRNFEPCLSDCAVVTEQQADLELCFDPGREVLAYEGIDQLNEIHERLLADPAWAMAIGRAGRRRVLAEHTYARRLKSILAFV